MARRSAAVTQTSSFLNTVPDSWGTPDLTYDGDLSKTRKLETLCKNARIKVTNLEKEVVDMEVKLGITNRWDPTRLEYLETLKYITRRKYHRALDDLQRLVVQRLFELHRLGLSGIGEYHFPLRKELYVTHQSLSRLSCLDSAHKGTVYTV